MSYLFVVLDSNYILFAEARGETLWQRVRRHSIRNVVEPAIMLHLASVSDLFGDTILAEVVHLY